MTWDPDNSRQAVDRVLTTATPGLNTAHPEHDGCECRTWNRVPADNPDLAPWTNDGDQP